MIYNNCKDCRKYKGDCGNHFKDGYGHIVYDIPSETYMDGALGSHGVCFEASEEYLKEIKKQKIRSMADKYTVEELEQALKELKVKNE